MIIDLISDTVTRPTIGMLEAMMHAKVGDDVFKMDPTVNALQEKAAAIFSFRNDGKPNSDKITHATWR